MQEAAPRMALPALSERYSALDDGAGPTLVGCPHLRPGEGHTGSSLAHLEMPAFLPPGKRWAEGGPRGDLGSPVLPGKNSSETGDSDGQGADSSLS